MRGEPLSFHIIPFDNPRQQCTLRARSPQHKREWTLQLKRVILENYSAIIPSHARQLVMQLGQNFENEGKNKPWNRYPKLPFPYFVSKRSQISIVVSEDTSSERWSPLKQHSTPQYLERRTRLRKSRDFSTNRRTASQDRSFPGLNWRRKSEPGIVNTYTTKTLPKKITKIKKNKDQTAKFYTDFSDSENCCDGVEVTNESLEEEGSEIQTDR